MTHHFTGICSGIVSVLPNIISRPNYQQTRFVGAFKRFAALLALLSTIASGQTLTWDANTTTTAAQNGSGTWNTTGTNWWDGTSNVSWVNSTSAIADIGVIGAVNPSAITITSNIQLAQLNFRPIIPSGNVATGTQFTLNGDVANREIDFGTNGLIQVDDRSSGGSQFIGLGANLTMRGSNLRIQKYPGSSTAIQFVTWGATSSPNLTGAFTLGSSIYLSITNPAQFSAISGFAVENGAAAALSGTGLNYTQPFSLAGAGNGTIAAGTAYGAIRIGANNMTFSGGFTLTGDTAISTNTSGLNGFTGTLINAPITESGGSYGFGRFAFGRGDSIVTLAAANTYTGATTLGRLQTGGYTGGITVLDYTVATSPSNNILYNNTAVAAGNLNLIGGASNTILRVIGRDAQIHQQRLGNVNVSNTQSALELIPGAGGGIQMSIGALNQVDVNTTLTITSTRTSSISTTTASGFLGPWVNLTNELGRRSWAQSSGGVLTADYAGSTTFNQGTQLNGGAYAPTTNLTLDRASTGTVTTGALTTNLGTISMNDANFTRLIELTAGQTLRLGTSGGVQIVNGGRDLTIGSAGVASVLSAGGTTTNTAGRLFLSNYSNTAALTIHSVIANNGTSGTVTLIVNGAPGSRTILNAANTHTGGTQISSGTVEVGHAGAFGTTGTVSVIEGASIQLNGGITLARVLAAVAGVGDGNRGAIRSVSGTNTLSALVTQTGPTYFNAEAGSTLNLTAATASTNIIDGAFALMLGGAGTINVNGRIAISSSGLTKVGEGTVNLAGNHSYTGATAITGGLLKLDSAVVLTTPGFSAGAGTLDLNGFSGAQTLTLTGSGMNVTGALVNSSGTTSTMTGASAISGSGSMVGGSGNITISNATGLTGNVLFTKKGEGTLTFNYSGASANTRSGTTQIDAGTLRLQAATALTTIGTGALIMNGGMLSLGFDTAGTVGGPVNMLGSSTIVADRNTGGAGVTSTLGAVTMAGSTLTVQAGANVSSGTTGLTLGSTTIGGAALAPGNPVFDVRSTSTGAMSLTLGALSDQAIAPRTLAFQNGGTAASSVTLGTAAGSLVDGTVVNIGTAGTGPISLNLNVAAALGTLAQANVDANGTLVLGAAQTLGSLAGAGTVNATGAFALTVGNALNSPAIESNFSGTLTNGAGTLSLTKAGKGTLTLSGSSANTYTGATTVNAGTLVLAKTGGVAAIGGNLAIGATAASTAGLATVRLDASDQLLSTAALTMAGGSTLNLNGFSQTVLTFSTAFGATVTGSGSTLAIANTSGTMTFTGVNNINSNLQLTTSAAATRTIAITSVTDQLNITGSVTQGSTIGTIAKSGSGTLTLSGNNSYAGTTTVSAGIINIRHANALGTTAGATAVSSGGTLQIQGEITTLAEGLTVSGTGFAGAGGLGLQTGALVNVSGTNNYAGLVLLGAAATISSDSGTLNLTHTGTMTGATFALTLAGAGDGSIASIIGNTTGGVVKNGAGTWTLSGVNTGTGAITINAGTLKLGNGTTGRWSSVPGLTVTGSGKFQYAGGTAATTQALGALTLTSGAGTLQVDAPSSGTNGVTFTSLAAPATGSGLNIVSPTNTSVTITGTSNVNGIVNARLTYNGTDFASSSSGVIGAASTTPATSSLTDGNPSPYLISGSFAQTGAATVNAGIKFASADTFTINHGVLLTLNNGAGTAGGILVTGGAAVIANEGSASGLTTAGTGDLVIRTNTLADSLTLQVPVTSTTTGGLTKSGLGTLTLNAASGYSGVTSINEGKIILGDAQALGTSNVTVQVGAVLDLNGRSMANAATLNGSGASSTGALINGSGSVTIGAVTIGTGFGTGGIGASLGGSGNILSSGVLVGNNLLVKTGSGTLTFGDNLGVALSSTRTGATRIDAGTLRISNSSTAIGAATAVLILNGGSLSLGSGASVAAYPTAVTDNSAILSDSFSASAGIAHTLGTLAIGNSTLTIGAGSNITVAAANAGVTFAGVTLTGSPTFDVRSPTTSTGGTTTLTLAALNDQGSAKTITLTNTGSSSVNGNVTLATAAGSLMEGTKVNLVSGANAGVTLNLNLAAALGTLAQVSVGNGSILNVGAVHTIASLAGSGTVSASGAFALTVGNANSNPSLSTEFSGSLTNGAGTLALTKNGLGTLTLSGSNSYGGVTTVSAGILKLASSTALGATSGITVAAGATVDLNGQTTDRSFSSISGTGHEGLGALINTNTSITAVINGNSVLAAVTKIGGAGNITFNNTGGLTGSSTLTKAGAGTLTFINTTVSGRTGVNQIDAGTLRLQSAIANATIGTGAMALNGGTLSLGYDSTGTVGGVVNVISSSTLIVDRATSSAGGNTLTLGALTIGGSTFNVRAGDNVSSGTIGLTLGTTSIGGSSMLAGNPVFNVQGSSTASLNLTLGALTDQGIGARTLTFRNSGAGASIVTLGTAAASLLNGTVIDVQAGASAGITLASNFATALGSVSRVQLTNQSGNIAMLSVGASQTLLSVNGDGSITSSSSATLTIGNPAVSSNPDSSISGVVSGASLSLVKAGGGSLTIGGSQSNSFAGGLTAQNGLIFLAKTGGAVAVPGPLTIGTFNGSNGSATVRLDGDNQLGSTSAVMLHTGSALNLNGNSQTIGALNGTPGSQIYNNASATTSVLTVGSGDATGADYLGIISDNTTGTGVMSVVKTGTGSLAFSGANSYSGTTAVQGGTLQVGVHGVGQTGTGSVTLASGSTLIGTGVVQGASFTAASGSTIYAGDGTTSGTIGKLTFTPASGAGTIDVQSGSTMFLDITPGGTSDLISFIGTGSNSLLFNGSLTVFANAYIPTLPEIFKLIDWSGLSTAPTFASHFSFTGYLLGNGDEAAGLDLPDISGSGYGWDITNFITNGSIATVVLIPEPSRMLLTSLAFLLLLHRRRR